MAEKLSFKHFYTVEYRPGEDEQTNYRAYRRRRTESVDWVCGKCSCDPCTCENVAEALSVASRLQKARSLRKNKAKIALGRARAARRFASNDVLKRRARKAAYNTFYKKLIKGIPKGDLSPQRKAEIEKRLQKPAFKTRIDRMSKKLVKDVRKKEMARKRA
tara:strand:+ start:2261 stop:2743 length:483 start_codon:yes stop_codon:yes gene_type:complete